MTRRQDHLVTSYDFGGQVFEICRPADLVAANLGRRASGWHPLWINHAGTSFVSSWTRRTARVPADRTAGQGVEITSYSIADHGPVRVHRVEELIAENLARRARGWPLLWINHAGQRRVWQDARAGEI